MLYLIEKKILKKNVLFVVIKIPYERKQKYFMNFITRLHVTLLI